ncbi:MAG: ankyrin repeat domain-containing protein [Nitrososphaerota archaeon]
MEDFNYDTFYRDIREGNFESIKQTLESLPPENRADVINKRLYENWFGTALHLAVRHAHVEKCQCHLYLDGAEYVSNHDRVTPYRREITRFLLENGADPELEDYYGLTPLETSVANSLFSSPAPETFYVIVRFILEKKLSRK